MAYEILNNAQVTPHRLHALARLVARMPGIDRETALDLVAPRELDEAQSSAKSVFLAAQHCRIIAPEADRSDAFKLVVDAEDVATIDGFRAHMRGVVLGVTEDTKNNFLFNQYAAWYAAQDERVLSMGRDDFHVQFNTQMHADSQDRVFNSTKRNGWETWAAFLGLGWPLNLAGRSSVFVPDARQRVAAVLPSFLPSNEREFLFSEFVGQLAHACPEIDGGILFERAWDASRSTPRGNRLSLMLSNALRGLHETRQIELVRASDARDMWELFPASGFEIQLFSHIRLGNVQ